MHHCEPLCDQCRHQQFMQLKGVAACRGETMADQWSRRLSSSAKWPTDRRVLFRLAALHVADLATDDTVRRMLAEEAIIWAKKRWDAAIRPALADEWLTA